MEDILDQPVFQPDRTNVKYGTFWPRLGASLLDTLIIAPVTMVISYFVTLNNPVLFCALTLATVSYKPFMEASYGATLGKMALKLKVTNLELEPASIGEVLLRNIFHIVPSVASLIVTFLMYTNSGFLLSDNEELTSFGSRISTSQYVSMGTGLIGIIDAIVLMVDQQSRSLHDKIAGTVVIVSRV